jgi:hypothetical protein
MESKQAFLRIDAEAAAGRRSVRRGVQPGAARGYQCGSSNSRVHANPMQPTSSTPPGNAGSYSQTPETGTGTPTTLPGMPLLASLPDELMQRILRYIPLDQRATTGALMCTSKPMMTALARRLRLEGIMNGTDGYGIRFANPEGSLAHLHERLDMLRAEAKDLDAGEIVFILKKIESAPCLPQERGGKFQAMLEAFDLVSDFAQLDSLVLNGSFFAKHIYNADKTDGTAVVLRILERYGRNHPDPRRQAIWLCGCMEILQARAWFTRAEASLSDEMLARLQRLHAAVKADVLYFMCQLLLRDAGGKTLLPSILQYAADIEAGQRIRVLCQAAKAIGSIQRAWNAWQADALQIIDSCQGLDEEARVMVLEKMVDTMPVVFGFARTREPEHAGYADVAAAYRFLAQHAEAVPGGAGKALLGRLPKYFIEYFPNLAYSDPGWKLFEHSLAQPPSEVDMLSLVCSRILRSGAGAGSQLPKPFIAAIEQLPEAQWIAMLGQIRLSHHVTRFLSADAIALYQCLLKQTAQRKSPDAVLRLIDLSTQMLLRMPDETRAQALASLIDVCMGIYGAWGWTVVLPKIATRWYEFKWPEISNVLGCVAQLSHDELRADPMRTLQAIGTITAHSSKTSADGHEYLAINLAPLLLAILPGVAALPFEQQAAALENLVLLARYRRESAAPHARMLQRWVEKLLFQQIRDALAGLPEPQRSELNAKLARAFADGRI